MSHVDVSLASIAQDWWQALQPVHAQLESVLVTVQRERDAAVQVLPQPQQVLRAFQQPLSAVRVLIAGQDPYPTPGHPIGLAFAVERHVHPLPRSLSNIFRELRDDLGIEPARHGDLTRWTEHGVLLLNRVLTVRAGQPGSHRGIGWEAITECAIDALVARGTPLVAVLWGQDAQTLAPRVAPFPVIASPHPSPLSASRGFFGSRPFSRANALLIEQGAEPIDWRVNEEADPPELEGRLF